MVSALYGAIEAGLLYGIMALGVYLTFRILDFPDLTVDGSFVTGGAVSAVMILNGFNPFLATMMGGLAGVLAGFITGILHTKGKINSLLSGILMMIALYSINLRIMGRPNIPLLNETTVFTQIKSFWDKLNLDHWLSLPFESLGIEGYLPATFMIIVSMAIIILITKKVIDWLLQTEAGLALRATGDNPKMIKSLSANTDLYIMVGLGISNGLVALSGSLVVQYNGFSDVGLGIGMIIVGLASVIIGEGIFGNKRVIQATRAVVLGAIAYRIIISLAMRIEFLDASDMKVITAIIVIGALIVPNWWKGIKEQRRRYVKKTVKHENKQHKGASTVATTKAD